MSKPGELPGNNSWICACCRQPENAFTNGQILSEGYSPSNSLVHRVPDPITNRYRFKLSTAKVERLGESPYKNDFRYMSFKPRDVA